MTDPTQLPLGEGPIGFRVGRIFARPAAEVFAALTSAETLARTFVLRASGDLDAPGEVEWWWAEGASSRLLVESVDAPRSLSLSWHGHRVGYRTRVRLEIEPRGDGGAHARFEESGWDDDAAGRESAFSHAEAWTELLAATEAWLEHGVGLKPRRR